MRAKEDVLKALVEIEIVKISIRNKIAIGTVLALSTLSAIIFTSPFFMKPKYKAEAIIYPPSSNTANALISSDIHFGSERNVDNQIQILKSTIVRDSIIRLYHLMNHYGIDSTSSKRFYLVNQEFASNVIVERTQYNSISVTVLDADPSMAAKIANDIVRVGDEVKAGIIKTNLSDAFGGTRGELNQKTVAALNNLYAGVPGSYVISPAEASMIRVYPKRLTLILMVSVSTYFLAILFFVFEANVPDNLKKFGLS
jgi:capsular polysaccharide biosynthesis protein